MLFHCVNSFGNHSWQILVVASEKTYLDAWSCPTHFLARSLHQPTFLRVTCFHEKAGIWWVSLRDSLNKSGIVQFWGKLTFHMLQDENFIPGRRRIHNLANHSIENGASRPHRSFCAQILLLVGDSDVWIMSEQLRSFRRSKKVNFLPWELD